MGVLRRWGVWVLILVAVVGALLIGSHRSSHPTLDQRAASLAAQVRCPVCGGESAAQSDVPAAVGIRNQIHAGLVAGQSSAQVLAGIEHSYGEWILEKPPAHGIGLLVWAGPVVVIGAAAAGLVVVLSRTQRAGAARRAAATAASPADEELVARALGDD